MSLRKCGLVAAMMCACALVAPVAASAQTTPTPITVSSLNSIPVTGKANNGKAFKNGHYSIQRFATRNNQTYAIGTLTGTVGHRFVRRSNVAIPVSFPQSSAAHAAATCQILNLTLGPLDLNLLGLHVHLNTVVLDITGTTGNGQLLGNLLCGIANLLNGGTPALTPAQLTGVLNIVQQLLTGVLSGL